MPSKHPPSCGLVHGSAPDYLKNLIVLSQPQTGLHTSNHANFLVPLPFPKYCQVSNAFRYSAPIAWNNLPPSIRSATSLSNFKSCLKAHYLNLAYENVQLNLMLEFLLIWIQCMLEFHAYICMLIYIYVVLHVYTCAICMYA